jgi:hypothetical protein
MKVWPSKDPDEELRYGYDWSPDLLPGETLTAAVAVTPTDAAGTTVTAVQHDDTTVTALISGGIDGQEASYLVRVTTSLDNTFEDTVVLPIIAKVEAVLHPGDYTPPTPANLLALYPEFGSVRPSLIDYYLQRAARSVDASWSEGDFAYGRMTLAAHLMTQAGLGSSAEAASVNDGSGQFKSMAIGSLRLERFDPAKDRSNLGSTRYGREFLRLLRLNRGGVRVTGRVPLFGGGDGDKAWY